MKAKVCIWGEIVPCNSKDAAVWLEINFLEKNLGNHVDLRGWQVEKSDASHEFSTCEAAFGV